MEDTNPFAGTWRLISWENSDDGGVLSYPYGRHPVGFLFYSADGYMAAEIMDPDRRQSDPSFPAEPAFAQTLPNADRLAAYDTYLSYCGTYSYSLAGGTITHHVEAGLIPAWAGGDQVREFAFEEGRLILGSRRARLLWKRAVPRA